VCACVGAVRCGWKGGGCVRRCPPPACSV
jgi:hypothetical protein